MRIRLRQFSVVLLLLGSVAATSFAAQAEPKLTRDIKVISSAGARALADACSAWAERNKLVVAMSILDWGGDLIESHAMEGAPGTRSIRRC